MGRMLRSLTRLHRYYAIYTGGFLLFVLTLAILEQHGMPTRWIGYAFLFFTIVTYAVIGIFSRTADVSEYYVAGRRVPAMLNGMATGADWMSAASFIGLAGSLYLSGFQGLAFVIGWTGGFVLVALFLAPYLRRFGEYTIPDFLGARYGGTAVRLVAVVAAILASFVYVVAQIYGVGVITSRFVNLQFEIGVFVGLAGILVCSFLGGMRAVTWTQVAQYVVIIVAYITPVALLSYKVTGVPVPQLVYGQVLQEVSKLERELFDQPAEIEARRMFRERADLYAQKIMHLPYSLNEEREALVNQIADLKAGDAPMRDIVLVEKQRRELPHDVDQARSRWEAAMFAASSRAKPPIHHAEAFPEVEDGPTVLQQQINFLALVFCLTIGTAALPHVLMRYYTTPSVREARNSVFWSIFFISLLYITAPAYAVFAKYEVFAHLAEIPIAKLPGWVAAWTKVGLVSIEDINGDGILQLAELSFSPDVIVLATPEIAGMPFVVSGLVAAGGLAAALSTADGLLLTITSALSHDLYYRIVRPQASTQLRLVISKSLLLVVAVLAASVAAQKPGTILYMVAWAFSIAGSAFFPALVLGIFWKRANRTGAVAGMLAGLMVALYYILRVESARLPGLAIGEPMEAWFGIQSISAGAFGVPVGFLVIVVVSLLTKPPPQSTQDFVENVRYPQDPQLVIARLTADESAPATSPGGSKRDYWGKNVKLTLLLLVVWATVTYLAPFFAKDLNEITILGFPLGFYMAAQGAVIVYVLVIWFYAWYMNRLDRKHGLRNQ